MKYSMHNKTILISIGLLFICFTAKATYDEYNHYIYTHHCKQIHGVLEHVHENDSYKTCVKPHPQVVEILIPLP